MQVVSSVRDFGERGMRLLGKHQFDWLRFVIGCDNYVRSLLAACGTPGLRDSGGGEYSRIVRALAALLIVVAAALLCSAGAWAYVYGPTPQGVALAATKKFAMHQVHAWNQPQVSYTLGKCRVLHRRPWLAYVCGFELHGVSLYCHFAVTVGVKHLDDRKYRGQAVRSRTLDDSGC
jgi:hypothetical protein